MFQQLIDAIENLFGHDNSVSGLFHDGEFSVDDIYSALTAHGVDLSQFTISEIQEALDNAIHNSNHTNQISFTGLKNIEPIADLQSGPTCGFEAIENFIQLNNPSCTNSLSEYLQKSEIFDGGSLSTEGGLSLNPQHYQHILGDFGIPTEWHAFSHETLMHALEKNRGILAVGDAHYLNPTVYPSPQAYHAFMVTDVSRDTAGNVIGYKGIDSNFPAREASWTMSQVEQAVNHAQKNLLVSMNEMKWPHKTA